MLEKLYPSASSLPPYKLLTIHLPSSHPSSPPTPIATLLPGSLSTTLTSARIVPSYATPYPSDPSFEILETPTSGLGMFSTRSIKAGELILNEHPVLIVPECPLPNDSTAWDDLARELPERERTEMLTMANCRPVEECPSLVEGIVRTNALILDLNTPGAKKTTQRRTEDCGAETIQRFGGVFLKINRCNHSCGPNAAHKWDTSNLSSKLYALRTIEPGEEITIFYTDVTQPRDVRRTELFKNHRFLCTCLHCRSTALSPLLPEGSHRALIQASDESRSQLRHWLSTHPSYLKWSTDLCRADDTVIASHHLALDLIDKENLHFLQHVFLEELVLSYAILGDEDQFRFWAKEFVQKCSMEDPERAKEFAVWLHDPKQYKKWGWRQKQRALERKQASSPVYGCFDYLNDIQN